MRIAPDKMRNSPRLLYRTLAVKYDGCVMRPSAICIEKKNDDWNDQKFAGMHVAVLQN
jgi:hypothetical protein